MLHTIQAKSVTAKSVEDVYIAVKSGIGERRYAPGEYLREEQIARGLGVSRTPVREAFRRLGAEGWLEVRPNQGARVKTWSVRDAEEIFEARLLIEPYLAGCAATRIDAAQIQTLTALADEMREVAKQKSTAESTEQWFAANARFHGIITESAGNARLNEALRFMKEVPLIKWTFDNYSAEDRERSVRQHFEIVQAIMHRDSAWAEAIVKCHILAAQKSVLANLMSEAAST